ncbi:MAG: iron-containing redox enzyme family protein [Dehalococcoidia bacterium]|nr:iron-containing redox enzyme family protein [Dehalococcoidia bacterium]
MRGRTTPSEVRQMLLENLWDEEHGERNHPRLWLDFAEALDVPEADVTEAELRPETQALVDLYQQAAHDAPLGEALATLFAYEGQVPDGYDRGRRVRRASSGDFRGFSRSRSSSSRSTLVADLAHSGHEMAAIDMAAEDEDRVLEATSEACDRLLGFLDGCMAGGEQAR